MPCIEPTDPRACSQAGRVGRARSPATSDWKSKRASQRDEEQAAEAVSHDCVWASSFLAGF